MPEGHTIHRLAAGIAERFGGRPVRVDSPQGKFADGAALIDGQVLAAADAHGKHLFLGFPGFADFSPGSGDAWADTWADTWVETWVHIHLGLYGKVSLGSGPPPPPAGQIRLRLVGSDAYAELRGPNTCALVGRAERQAIRERLGPDPLRADADADPGLAWRRIAVSRTPIAVLLLDQRVLAGVGNVYRAEVLFRHGIDPHRPGRELGRAAWDAIWADLAELMAEGVRTGRIDTVRPEHTPEAMGRPPRVDDHGGEVYVYRRAGQPCHLCGARVRTAALAGRNLFWCPGCQR
jgi:endonuclease-8